MPRFTGFSFLGLHVFLVMMVMILQSQKLGEFTVNYPVLALLTFLAALLAILLFINERSGNRLILAPAMLGLIASLAGLYFQFAGRPEGDALLATGAAVMIILFLIVFFKQGSRSILDWLQFTWVIIYMASFILSVTDIALPATLNTLANIMAFVLTGAYLQYYARHSIQSGE